MIRKVGNDRCCQIQNSQGAAASDLRPENMVRGNADFIKQSFQVHDGHIKTILVAI